MPLKEGHQQISVVLSKEVIEKLDKMAEEESRSRSQQAAKIIIDYFKKLEDK